MESAAQRLRRTRQPVTSIALDAGYQTPESFSRTFHNQFGRSPSDFRKTAQSRQHRGAMIDVKIVKRAPVAVAFMRYVGPPDNVGRSWEKLSQWVGQHGFFGPGTEFIGVWRDDPQITRLKRLRCDVCVTLPRMIEPVGEVGVREIAGGTYACTTHRGPYDKLASTYATLCGIWAPQSGWEIAPAPAVEIYRNSPRSVAPEQLITEIYLPLQ
jgi:AraC family transcriptional regulator